MAEIQLRIEGMHCGACIRRVTQALQTLPGSKVESVRLGAARVQAKGDLVTPKALIDAIEKIGFKAFQEE
jgi:copper chaperone